MPLPPLVPPADALPPGELERASRQTRLPEIGEEGQRRLSAAKVCILGAGGLGSPAMLYLAAAGLGTIGIVDDDIVETSNLQRQIAHGATDVDEPKTASAARGIRALSPHTRVIEHRERLTDANAADVLGGYDVVLDGTDTFDTRYLVSDVCAELGIPVVWASVLRFDAQVCVFWSRPPAGIPAVTLRDVFPQPPQAGEVPSCSVAGVLGPLCGQAGSIMATEAIKLICGIGEPLIGRMLVLDALAGRVTEVPITPSRAVSTVVAGGQFAESARLRRARPLQRARSSESGTLTSGTLTSGILAPGTLAPGTLTPGGAAEPSGEITVDELLELTASGAPIDLVDVREPAEHAAGAIPGSRLVPLGALLRDPAALGGDAGAPGALVLYCEEGPRARTAARILAVAGIRGRVLQGGVAEWREHLRAQRTAV